MNIIDAYTGKSRSVSSSLLLSRIFKNPNITVKTTNLERQPTDRFNATYTGLRMRTSYYQFPTMSYLHDSTTGYDNSWEIVDERAVCFKRLKITFSPAFTSFVYKDSNGNRIFKGAGTKWFAITVIAYLKHPWGQTGIYLDPDWVFDTWAEDPNLRAWYTGAHPATKGFTTFCDVFGEFEKTGLIPLVARGYNAVPAPKTIDPKALSDCENSLTQARSDYASSKIRLDDALGKLAQALEREASLKEEIAKLRQQISAGGAGDADLQAQLAQAQKDLQIIKEERDLAVKNLAGISATNRDLLKAKSDLQAERANMIADLNAANRRIQELQAALEKGDGAASEIPGLVDKIATLEQELKKAKETADHLRTKIQQTAEMVRIAEDCIKVSDKKGAGATRGSGESVHPGLIALGTVGLISGIGAIFLMTRESKQHNRGSGRYKVKPGYFSWL